MQLSLIMIEVFGLFSPKLLKHSKYRGEIQTNKTVQFTLLY
jgi:hypothetical protein